MGHTGQFSLESSLYNNIPIQEFHKVLKKLVKLQKTLLTADCKKNYYGKSGFSSKEEENLKYQLFL